MTAAIVTAELFENCKSIANNLKKSGGFRYEITPNAARGYIDEPAWRNVLKWEDKMTLARTLACLAAGVGGDLNEEYVVVYSDRTNKMLASGYMSTFSEE
jgi:hypothetical protein